MKEADSHRPSTSLPLNETVQLVAVSCACSCSYEALTEYDSRVGLLVQVAHYALVLTRLLPDAPQLLRSRSVPLRDHLLPVFLCWLSALLHVKALTHGVPFSFVLLSKSWALLLSILLGCFALDDGRHYGRRHLMAALVMTTGLVTSTNAASSSSRQPEQPRSWLTPGVLLQLLSVCTMAALDAAQQRVFAQSPSRRDQSRAISETGIGRNRAISHATPSRLSELLFYQHLLGLPLLLSSPRELTDCLATLSRPAATLFATVNGADTNIGSSSATTMGSTLLQLTRAGGDVWLHAIAPFALLAANVLLSSLTQRTILRAIAAHGNVACSLTTSLSRFAALLLSVLSACVRQPTADRHGSTHGVGEDGMAAGKQARGPSPAAFVLPALLVLLGTVLFNAASTQTPCEPSGQPSDQPGEAEGEAKGEAAGEAKGRGLRSRCVVGSQWPTAATPLSTRRTKLPGESEAVADRGLMRRQLEFAAGGGSPQALSSRTAAMAPGRIAAVSNTPVTSGRGRERRLSTDNWVELSPLPLLPPLAPSPVGKPSAALRRRARVSCEF